MRFRLENLLEQWMRKQIVDRHEYSIFLGDEDYQEFRKERFERAKITGKTGEKLTNPSMRVWGAEVYNDSNVIKGEFELRKETNK